MKLSSLFIDIQLKGGKDISRLLKDINNDLKFAASAFGLIEAVNWFKGVTSGAADAGYELQKFQALTGMSADKLQDWQLWAMKSGASAQEMADSMFNARKALNEMILQGKAPQSLGALINQAGFDINKAGDVNYLFERLKVMSEKMKGSPLLTSLLAPFGLGTNVQFAMTQGRDVVKAGREHAFTEGEQKRLSDIRTRLNLLADTLEHELGHIVAKFGPELLGDLEAFTKSMIKLFHALETLAEHFQVVPWITKLTGVAASGIEAIAGGAKSIAQGKEPYTPLSSFLPRQPTTVNNTINNTINPSPGMDATDLARKVDQHTQKSLDQQNYRTYQAFRQQGGG